MMRITRNSRPAILALSLAGTLLGLSPARGQESDESTVPIVVEPSTPVSPVQALEVDLAKLRVNARVVYVSSGEKGFSLRMIDSDGRTAFRFFSGDVNPTVIVQLAHTERIHRVSTIFPAEAARLDVYLANELPRDPSNFRFGDPVGSITEVNGTERAEVDFAPQDVRYVVLRWTRKHRGGTFKVAEISAYGGGSLAFLDVEVAMPMPGEPAPILPHVPPVSPD